MDYKMVICWSIFLLTMLGRTIADTTTPPIARASRLSGNLENAAVVASSYISWLQVYYNSSAGIDSPILGDDMNQILLNVLAIPHDVPSLQHNDIDTIYLHFSDLSRAIESMITLLVQYADQIKIWAFRSRFYKWSLAGELVMLGLGYSAVASSLWDVFTANNIPCSTAMPIWSEMASVGDALSAANSAFSADAAGYLPSTYTCLPNRTTSTNISAAVTSPPAELYAGVGSAARDVVTTGNKSLADFSLTSTRVALLRLSSEINLARNAAAQYSSLVTESSNVRAFKSAGDDLAEALRAVHGFYDLYAGFPSEVKAILWELAAMVTIELEMAQPLPCDEYRIVVSEYMVLSTAHFRVMSSAYSQKLPAFPTLGVPYTHSCLQTGFERPAVSWPVQYLDGPTERKQTLSVGAWVGIVVGCAATVFLILVAAVLHRRMRTAYKRRQDAALVEASALEEPGLLMVVAPEESVLGTCAQCGSDICSSQTYVTCCEQLFHERCVGDDTICRDLSAGCIGSPVLPLYEKPPEYLSK